MDSQQLVADLAERAGIDDPAEARDTLAAVARGLGFVLPEEEVGDAAAQLPDEVAGSLTASAGGRPGWEDDELVAYVAEQTGVDGPTARSRIGHGLATLRGALTTGEYTDLVQAADPSITGLLPEQA